MTPLLKALRAPRGVIAMATDDGVVDVVVVVVVDENGERRCQEAFGSGAAPWRRMTGVTATAAPVGWDAAPAEVEEAQAALFGGKTSMEPERQK